MATFNERTIIIKRWGVGATPICLHSVANNLQNVISLYIWIICEMHNNYSWPIKTSSIRRFFFLSFFLSLPFEWFRTPFNGHNYPLNYCPVHFNNRFTNVLNNSFFKTTHRFIIILRPFPQNLSLVSTLYYFITFLSALFLIKFFITFQNFLLSSFFYFVYVHFFITISCSNFITIFHFCC